MTQLLIIAVVVLGIIAIAQLAKVHELTKQLSGTREEEIPERENRMNGRLMWLFPFVYFAFFLWLIFAYRDQLLPVSASEHGVRTDNLLTFNWVILFIAFFITNILLFYYAGKYYHKKSRKAFYYPHNNKLELIWTVVPAIVLAAIIIYGLNVWNSITAPPAPDSMKVELYAKQFDWTARYPGADGELGATDFRLINDNNPLGIVTKTAIAQRISEIEEAVTGIEQRLANEVLPESTVEELEDQADRLRRTHMRILNLRSMMEQDIAEKGEASSYMKGADDLVIKEFHLPVKEEVDLVFRSRDVIHSAYLPHLRMQMNCVPGMATTFKMVPTITTDSMRLVTGNKDFEYVLLCNKICGASHYNMQMNLIVEPKNDFTNWMAGLAPFEGVAPVVPVEQDGSTEGAATDSVPAPSADPTEVAVIID